MPRLSPVQRAYLMGHRRAKREAQREMADELLNLQDEFSEIADVEAIEEVEPDPTAWSILR